MKTQKALQLAIFSFTLLIGALILIPSPAKADFNPLNPLDPFCLFTNCNSNQNVTNTTYNTNGSYNTNSYNGSTYVTPVVTNTTPIYNYNGYTNTTVAPLYVSCYPTPTGITVGNSVTWGSSVSGGNGSYYITWSGSDGLSGNGSTISKTYYSQGSKNASVTVTSGGQTLSQNCSGSVNVYDYSNSGTQPIYTYPVTYTQPVVYNPPVYYPPVTYYPLSVSCTANTTYTTTGSYVTWYAYVTGGNYNSYTTYSWSGTDGLYGSQSTISTYYSNPGTKYAYVTAYTNGQNVTAQCTSPVTITSSYNNYNYSYVAPVSYSPNYGSNLGLQIACAVDKVSATVGTPVTWTVEAIGSGNYTNYSYAWTGSDGLSGNQSSIITTYTTPGLKSAVVTITTQNGQSQSKACTNTVTIKSATKAAVTKKPAVVAAVSTAPQVVNLPPSQAAAAGLFSLQNVPWGWVAILVILVLFGMVFYMAFNKKKI